MAGEKTEQPTPKKLKDSRRDGHVFKSGDLTQALLFFTAVGALSAGGGAYLDSLKTVMRDIFSPAAFSGRLGTDELLHRVGAAWGKPLLLLVPLLGALAAVSAMATLLQVKPLFAPKAIQFKPDKLNPIKGLQNIFFKPRTYLEMLKNLVKFAIVFAVAYFVIQGSIHDIIMTAGADLSTSGTFAAALLFRLLFRVAFAFLFIGAADLVLQKRLYLKELMMSKDEVKREFKEEEGDPHIKAMRKHLHEQILASSMMNKVRTATAVVVNPTHLAVALEYSQQTMSAPAVAAKGQEAMAQKIIEIAKQYDVPVVRNVPLAHGLFAVEIGQEIPEELYEAVAEVLNWVYLLAQSAQE